MIQVTLDIGGSKVRGYSFEKDTKNGFEIIGGFGLAEDKKGVNKQLIKALKAQFGRGRYKVETAAINLGGRNKGQILRSVQATFPNAKIKVYREAEGEIALKILQLYQADILVMAGTGCISFAKNEKKGIVYGGWGKDFSDEGSGYYIGALAMRHVLKELDGYTSPFSLLTQELTGEKKPFDFQTVQEYPVARDLIWSRLPKTREGVAAITKTVVKCAENGCKVSREILKENALAIKNTIEFLAKRIGKENPKVVINGGISNTKSLWESYLQDIDNIIYINDGIDSALKSMAENIDKE